MLVVSVRRAEFMFKIVIRYNLRKAISWFGVYSIRERRFVLENIDHSSSKKILDIGCCESLLPEELGKRGHRVFGIDIRDYGRCRNFKFLKADITKRDSLPFNDRTFDYIISLSTLEHIGLGYYGGDLNRRGDRMAVEVIHSLLKPDGKFLVTLPFSGKYTENSFQRIHTKESFQTLISGYFRIEKQQFWIPKSKKNWIAASEEEVGVCCLSRV